MATRHHQVCGHSKVELCAAVQISMPWTMIVSPCRYDSAIKLVQGFVPGERFERRANDAHGLTELIDRVARLQRQVPAGRPRRLGVVV